MKTKRSFRFKILSTVLVSMLLLLAITPVIISKTIDATVSEYEKQSAHELQIVFNSFLNNHYASLTSQMNNWFQTSAGDELLKESPSWKTFEQNLLGIGNSINSSHGVEAIAVYNLENQNVLEYKTELKFDNFKTDPKAINRLINKSKKSEMRVFGELIGKSGKPFLVLVIPSEDDDEDINFFHLYYMNVAVFLDSFSTNLQLPAILDVGGNLTETEKFDIFNKAFHQNISNNNFKIGDKVFKLRSTQVSKNRWQGAASLSVAVEMTTLEKALVEVESIGFGVLLTSMLTLLFFLFMLINKLVKSFENRVKVLENVATNSLEISASLNESSERGAEIANSESSELGAASAAATEISEILRSSQEHAASAVQLAANSEQTAKQGDKVIDKMIDEIKEIGLAGEKFINQVKNGNQKMAGVADRLDEISKKTTLINEIVFSTKLLSFNASVEAARAGEQGKGFAVVAEEIGILAQNSGAISNEINGIVESSVEEVKNIVNELLTTTEFLAKENNEKIESASNVGLECKDSLKRILNCSHEVNETVAQISASSSEQALAVKDIADSVKKIEALSYENKNAAGKNAEYSIQMKEEVSRIVSSAKEMNVLLKGTTAVKKDIASSN